MRGKFFIGVLSILLFNLYIFSAEENRENAYKISLIEAVQERLPFKIVKPGFEELDNHLIIENFLKETKGYVFPKDILNNPDCLNKKTIKRKNNKNISPESRDKRRKTDDREERVLEKIWEIDALEGQVAKVKDDGFNESTFESMEKFCSGKSKKHNTRMYFTPRNIVCIPRYSLLFNIFSEKNKKRILILAQYILRLKEVQSGKAEKIEIDEELDLDKLLLNYNTLMDNWDKKSNRISQCYNRVKRVCDNRNLIN